MIKPLRKRSANLPSKLSKAARAKRARIVQEHRDKATSPKGGRKLKVSDTATGSGKIRFAASEGSSPQLPTGAYLGGRKLSRMSSQALAEMFPHSAGSILGEANKALSTSRGPANSLPTIPRDHRETQSRSERERLSALPERDEESELALILDLLALTSKTKRGIRNREDLEPYLHSGLSVRAMRNFRKYLQITASELATLVGTSPRRCRHLLDSRGALDLATSDRLYRLATVVAEATTTFGSHRNAALWLRTPNLALNAETPIARLGTEIGTLRVRELLVNIGMGHFV